MGGWNKEERKIGGSRGKKGERYEALEERKGGRYVWKVEKTKTWKRGQWLMLKNSDAEEKFI